MKSINKTEETIEGRKLSGKIGLFVLIFCVLTSLIHIWYNSFGLIDVLRKDSIHLTLMMGIIFLTRPALSRSPKDRPSIMDWILFFLSIGSGIYFRLAYFRFVDSLQQPNFADLIYGVITIILIIEAARRTVGIPFTLLCVFFLGYVYFGPYMPGMFVHQGFDLKRIIVRMTMTSEGVLGVVIMISASYVFMFILFASFLKVTKASEFIKDLSSALTGEYRGGPAKIAAIASGLTGTISGSSQANVATTGSFTIPLMKSVGYEPYFAGAIEAIASQGGVFMPPVMGASAFIMSSFLGIPYLTIMLAGFTPAFLYYFTLYHMIDLKAAKLGLIGISKSKLPNLKKVILDKGYLLIPLILIIVVLLIGYSPLSTAFVGIVSVLIVSTFRKSTRLSFEDIIFALNEGARNGAPIAVICGIVGFIVCATGMTGIGQVIGSNIVKLAGAQLWLTALFCMITAIILGMGLPGAACYIVTVTIAAPALIMLGIRPIIAHFFAFYFGAMSGVIPPVALTSFTAAAIAKANPTKVALTALILGSAGLLIPYMFLYNNVLLLVDFSWPNYLFSLLCAVVGLYSIAIAFMGMLKMPLLFFERIPFIIAAILLITPKFNLRILGFVFFIIAVAFHLLRARKYIKKEKSNF